MKKKNPLAVALGKLGRGHRKTLSTAERELRRQRMIRLNATRASAAT